ncbi:MAG: flagellar basal body L-ring protein FlgH [Myxococcota bacterium]
MPPSIPRPHCRLLGAPVLLGALLTLGCGPTHIGPHTPRERDYQVGEYEREPVPVSGGSLWLESSRGLFADFRASRVGDLVTIRIDETVAANGNASTQLDREAEHSFGMPSLLGFMGALTQAHPGVDPSRLLEVMSEYGFNGAGQTQRNSQIRGTVAVRVKRELPNGDLFVEGTKVILVNEEELHVYISGVIRPQDIEQDNSVRSSLVADAQVEFSGRGALTNNQRQGWLSRIISQVRPF